MSLYPLVSVIIPTYNRAGVICQTIDDVFKQTYPNFELIVVDDGSTDETQSNLRQYRDRIRIVTQDNAGPAAARNRGIKASHGDIIAFQDSDDLWKSTKLERQVSLLSRVDKTVPCCLCNAIVRVEDGNNSNVFGTSCIKTEHEEAIWLNVMEVLATRFVLFNQTVIIRRESLERVGGYDESLAYLEDYDLSLRLALEGPWGLIREPLVIYRVGSLDSLTRRGRRDEVSVKERELEIFERTLARVKSRSRDGSVERQLKRRLRTFRRGLTTAKLSRSDSFGAQAIGRLLEKVDHYLIAAFRRSPWFPKAITLPVYAANPHNVDSEGLVSEVP